MTGVMNRDAVIRQLKEAMEQHSIVLARTAIKNIEDIHMSRSGFHLIDADSPDSNFSELTDHDRERAVYIASKRLLLGPRAEAVHNALFLQQQKLPTGIPAPPVQYWVTVRLEPPLLKPWLGFFECMAVLGDKVKEVRELAIKNTGTTTSWSEDKDTQKQYEHNQGNIRELVATQLEKGKSDAKWVNEMQQEVKKWQQKTASKDTDPVDPEFPCLASMTYEKALAEGFEEHLDDAAKKVRDSNTPASPIEMWIVQKLLQGIKFRLMVVEHVDEEASLLSRLGMALWEESTFEDGKDLFPLFIVRRGDGFSLAHLRFTERETNTHFEVFELPPEVKMAVWKSTTDEPLPGHEKGPRRLNKEMESSLLIKELI